MICSETLTMWFYFTGDKDEYDALERHVKNIIDTDQLAAHVSVHNLCSVTNYNLPATVFAIWPTPRKGFTAKALFNIQQHIRKLCRDSSPPIELIGHSTDSAGFSLSLSKWVMTPQPELVQICVKYLGLGIRHERFLSPYFWKLPTIMYTDFEHNQRSCLRNLKYQTRELTIYKEDSGSLAVTIDHLTQLRRICNEHDVATNLSELDLIQLKYCDQNSDAAYKVFSIEIARLLDTYVEGSIGTSLFITAIRCIMEPARNVSFGSPPDVVRSVAKGIVMLRLWRR